MQSLSEIAWEYWATRKGWSRRFEKSQSQDKKKFLEKVGAVHITKSESWYSCCLFFNWMNQIVCHNNHPISIMQMELRKHLTHSQSNGANNQSQITQSFSQLMERLASNCFSITMEEKHFLPVISAIIFTVLNLHAHQLGSHDTCSSYEQACHVLTCDRFRSILPT